MVKHLRQASVIKDVFVVSLEQKIDSFVQNVSIEMSNSTFLIFQVREWTKMTSLLPECWVELSSQSQEIILLLAVGLTSEGASD